MERGDGGEVGGNGCVAAGFCWGEFGAYRNPLCKVFVAPALPVFAVVVLGECGDELGLEHVDMCCEYTNAFIQNTLIFWCVTGWLGVF